MEKAKYDRRGYRRSGCGDDQQASDATMAFVTKSIVRLAKAVGPRGDGDEMRVQASDVMDAVIRLHELDGSRLASLNTRIEKWHAKRLKAINPSYRKR